MLYNADNTRLKRIGDCIFCNGYLIDASTINQEKYDYACIDCGYAYWSSGEDKEKALLIPGEDE